jgi:LmbE family N-acetylglucosaminyl deacetylase
MIDASWNKMRDWTMTRLLRRVHRVTHRLTPSVRRVERSRVLLFAPHMDDGMISSGGTIALHKRAGSDVGFVYVSDSRGDSRYTGVDSQTNIREQEAVSACEFMGVEIVDMLGFPDRSLSLFETEIAQRIGDLIDRWRPQQIFCPFPTDQHRDHQATAMSVALALAERNWKGEVWGYEVWSTLWPNAVVDISKVVEVKSSAISLFASQATAMPYVEATLGLNRYRGLQAQVKYAEAFYVCSPRKLSEMCQPLNQI